VILPSIDCNCTTSEGGVRVSSQGGDYGGMGNFFAFAIVIYVLLVIILKMGVGYGAY
jgi:hypothetical protein